MSEPSGPDAVTLEYVGHCAFLWTSPHQLRVLVDPYGDPSGSPPWFVRPMPPTPADMVLVTHDHFDHNAVHRVSGTPSVLRGPGRFEVRDTKATGIPELHVPSHSPEGMDNVPWIFETGGIRFCHLGDNRSGPGEVFYDMVGIPDVLMIAVDDSCHLLTFGEVDAIVASLRPSVVIPMHYMIPGVTESRSTLLSADGWLAGRPRVRRGLGSVLRLTPDSLPAEREVWVMEASAAP